MKYRTKLFSKRPYDDQTDSIFTKAMAEGFAYQCKHNAVYARLANGALPNGLQKIEDIADLPLIPTLFFKRHNTTVGRPFVTVTSSGTSGQHSKVGYDFGGLFCALKMSIKVGKQRKLFSARACHYIIMGYKSHKGNKMSVAKSAYAATLFTPSLSRNYILNWDGNSYQVDFDGIIAKVQKFVRSKHPTRFMGFPAYTYFLMKKMDERGINVTLPKGSKIMLGGGWKQFYAEQTDKQTFYDLANKVLGISDDNIVEFFGAVEHPILSCDCPCHHFHVPAYSRVIIRDVDTLQPLPNGQVGLINLLTPLIKSTPLLSVMTDDLGVLHDATDCPCGQKTPYLEIIGRVAPADIKTCAAGAEELIKGVKL